MERTDIHRPSAIKPEEYQFVAFDYIGGTDLGAIMALKVEKERLWAHMNQTGGKFANHEHGGTCYVCGALAMYLCTFYHTASNTYIKTGEDCAQKMDMSYDNMNYFRRAIADAREAKAGKAKAQAILADLGLGHIWALYGPNVDGLTTETIFDSRSGNWVDKSKRDGWQYEEMTINDIINKLVKYGSISDAQAAFIRKLLAKIDERPAIEAQRALEAANAADCPSGRVRIIGRVLGLKEVPDNFSRFGGTKFNALIQSNDGFKVYGSRFANVEKGESVDFVATVTPSDKDAKFGFFKRPLPYVDKELVKLMKTIAWG